MSKLSEIVKHAEFASGKRAIRVHSYTQRDQSHLLVVDFKDGTRKEMHAPVGPLEMDWELNDDFLRYQNSLARDIL